MVVVCATARLIKHQSCVVCAHTHPCLNPINAYPFHYIIIINRSTLSTRNNAKNPPLQLCHTHTHATPHPKQVVRFVANWNNQFTWYSFSLMHDTQFIRCVDKYAGRKSHSGHSFHQSRPIFFPASIFLLASDMRHNSIMSTQIESNRYIYLGYLKWAMMLPHVVKKNHKFYNTIQEHFLQAFRLSIRFESLSTRPFLWELHWILLTAHQISRTASLLFPLILLFSE